MAIRTISAPGDFADFMKGRSRSDIIRAEQLLNALQNLKLQVKIAGSNRVVTATIQISGDVALLEITL